MMERVYLGVDLGTQSVKVIAATADGLVAATAARPLASVRDGVRHTQDPAMWWTATAECLREVSAALTGKYEVAGLAVDATSGTILLVDGMLRPVSDALMYDDGRAVAEARNANEAGGELWNEMSYRMQSSWALPKLMWLLRNTKVARGVRLAHQNDFINGKLAGRMLAADSSHALKTGYDLIRSDWPSGILSGLRVPSAMLPDVVAPGTRIGEVCSAASAETGLAAGVPIFAGMTDGCAAQIASGATALGRWNSVVGTTLVVKGVTKELLHDPLGVVYSHRSADGLWLPGGASSTGAAAIAKQFEAADLERLNAVAAESGPSEVVSYPLVTKGERFPFAAPDAEGFTLGQADTLEEKYRGVLQGIALIERLTFDSLRELGATTDGSFSISGGATKSHALNQIRANILEKELSVPAVTESAFGMAVLACSTESSLAEATARMVRIESVVRPTRPFEEYSTQYAALVRELKKRGWLSPLHGWSSNPEVFA